MRKVLVVFLIFIIGLFVVTLAISSFTHRSQKNGVVDTASSFVSDILVNRCGDAYKLFTPNAQGATSNSVWLANCASLYAFFSDNKATVISKTQSGQNYNLNYGIKGLDGQYIFSLVLNKSGSGWLVSSFNSSLKSTST